MEISQNIVALERLPVRGDRRDAGHCGPPEHPGGSNIALVCSTVHCVARYRQTGADPLAVGGAGS